MFGLTKRMFIKYLNSIASASNHTKSVSLSNPKCKTQPITFTILNSNEYRQELHYYPFAVTLEKCDGSSDTLNELSNKLCVPYKIEDLNLIVLNMITGINESRTLTKHISCECKCKFYGRKCNSNQKWNNDKCQCNCKKHHIC